MPVSKGRKPKKRRASTRPGSSVKRSASTNVIHLDPNQLPPTDEIARTMLRGGCKDLKDVADPLLAEDWASQALSLLYKPPLPFDVAHRFESAVLSGVIGAAERQADGPALSVLRALAAVADDDATAAARAAGDRLRAAGIEEPVWAVGVGAPEFVDAFRASDPYDDQWTYYLRFRYPGREAHLLSVLYDQNLGGIIKDAFLVNGDIDLRDRCRTSGLTVCEVDPGSMASTIREAIRTGDMYIDNDWTAEFRDTRALLRARMRVLPEVDIPERIPLGEDARNELLEEFLASPLAPAGDETASIVGYCLDARCDYGDGDPLRWSPSVVQMFMLDHLPRKVSLDAAEIRALPVVLKAWVEFCLRKRGLDDEQIAATTSTIDELVGRFRREVTDHRNFGPAKAMVNAMQAAGVEIGDQAAMDAWVADFNERPFEERDAFLGTMSSDRPRRRHD